MSDPIVQVLEGAAKDLEDNGWCRGLYRNSKGQGCLVGAIRQEVARVNKQLASEYDGGVFTSVWPVEVLREVEKDAAITKRFINDAEGNLIDWNDAQRDKRKVIRLLRRVARNLRKQVEA